MKYGKVLIHAVPDARLNEYEEGVQTYINESRRPHTALNVVRDIRDRFHFDKRMIRSQGVVGGEVEARRGSTYLYLHDVLPLPERYRNSEYTPVATEHVLKTLGRAAGANRDTADSVVRQSKGSNDVLILPQCLHRYGIIDRDDELDIYRGVIDRFLYEGVSIYWKEHPRTDPEFWPELKSVGHVGLHRVNADVAMPVEVLAQQLCCSRCVGGASTALLYLRKLYGWESYTFGDLFPARARDEMSDLIRKVVPPIDQAFQNVG